MTEFSPDDTIAAIATPAGHGGIGIVRLSGPDACRITRALTRSATLLEPRRATFGRVRVDTDDGGRAIDHVVCTFFPGPRSYTGEDVVEISAHGNPIVLTRILAEATREGARLARPGEFTLRAYLSGRMDLVQAEAVADLVNAVTPAQARVAFDQLEGTLTAAVREIQRTILDLLVRLEASLDFPDEDYHFVEREDVRRGLEAAVAAIECLLARARAGRLIREGAHVVIAGRPNVGKSSLFNALLGVERAIVTPLAGTTRDLLTEPCDVGGVPVTFVDTAGLRERADVIEREGIQRAEQALAVADLCLLVVDRSAAWTAEDERLIVRS
jgi:tRNA modification GTPase